MKILLVSDSHRNNEILDDLYKLYPNMDLYLHAGDSEATTRMELGPFIAVLGNCDYYTDLPQEFEFMTPFGLLIMRHKPYVTERDKNKKVKIFIHGHTHVEHVSIDDGIIRVCPGSISFSRKGKESYMVLDIKENVISLTLYELDNKKVLYTREIL